MFIPLDISLADPLDIITFTYKNKVIEFTIIDKCVKENSEEIECEFNEKISKFKGRSQFNFDFGNYSKEPDEILDEYIIKMQRIGEE